MQHFSPFHYFVFFFFNDTATTEIYTLSLHDALPILRVPDFHALETIDARSINSIVIYDGVEGTTYYGTGDRKSTRLNSSHSQISYAVFCLKKKKKNKNTYHHTTTSIARTIVASHSLR